MFSKSKDPETAPAPQAPVVQPKRPPAARGVPSIISSELVVRGTLISAGDVQVDGKVDGDIRAASLVIGDKAVIEFYSSDKNHVSIFQNDKERKKKPI